MSTAPKMGPAMGSNQPKGGPDAKDQLFRDRVKGVAVLVAFFLLIGLAMWLASMAPAPEGIDYDYWMMP